MQSRSRTAADGPTVVYDTETPPHPYACNRAAKRFFKSTGQDHTAVPMGQLKRAGKDPAGKPIYFMGEERFVPPYLAPRVKRNKDRKSK